MIKMEENNKKKLLSMLGMARKAGRLIIGAEQVTVGVRKNSPFVVLITADASENTTKKVKNCCAYYEVECKKIDVSADELSHAIGKSASITSVGVTDVNFAKAIRQYIQDDTAQQ